MELGEVNNQSSWEAMFSESPHAHFLQSWDWGEFQSQVGNTVKRYLVGPTKIPVQVIVHVLPFGLSYWYIPYTIIGFDQLSPLINEAKKQKAVFIRLELIEPRGEQLPTGAVSVPPRQPMTTLIIDVTQPLAKIQADFHQKTRYNIGLAERKGVHIVWEKKPDIFVTLMQETTTRDRFKAHPNNYYVRLIENPLTEQGIAYVGDEPVASGIFIHYRQSYTYTHGASTTKHREYMAPYALQWTAIKRAQELRAHYYDFWGIAPQATESIVGNTTKTIETIEQFHKVTWKKSHPWAGVTRFKAGFGGEVRSVGSSFEIPVRNNFYSLIKGIKKILSFRI